MIYLRQSTASQEIPLGPFVDSTDGNTEETGLTINNTDILLWKTGATTLASKNSGGGTHISNGIYYATLDATDSDTLGPMVIFCHVSGALAVRVECCVLAANVYDSMIGASDALGVDIVQVSGDATAADNAESFFDGTGYAGTNNVIPTVTTATNVTTVNGLAANVITAASINADAVTEIQSGLSTLDAVGVRAAVGMAEANLDTQIAALPTAAANADAVWDEATSGHSTSGTTGAALIAAGSAGDPWSTSLPGAYGSGTAGYIVGNRLDAAVSSRASASDLATVDGIVDAILEDTGTTLPSTLATAANLATVDGIVDAILEDTGTTLPSTLAGLATAASVAALPTAAANADAVWDEATSGHTTSGTTGAALIAAGSAGDPWSTSLPGAYGSGTAGYIVGNRLDAAVSSRASASDLATVDGVVDAILEDTGTTLPSTLAGLATAANLATVDGVVDAILEDTGTTLPATLAGLATAASVAALPTAAANADAVWDEATSGHTSSGTTGAALIAAGSAGDPWSTSLPGAYGAGTAGYIVGNRLDAAVSSRASASDLATVDGIVDAILEDTGTTLPSTLAGLATAASVAALNDLSAAQVASEIADALTVDTIANSVAGLGAQPTFAQAVLELLQLQTEKAVSGTTVTVNQLDGATPSMTLTLDDDDAPTSITRAS